MTLNIFMFCFISSTMYLYGLISKQNFSRIIAINYEARARGVTKSMRGADAKVKCPDITLIHVPSKNEKADISKFVLLFF